jgi:hypothetical protein
VDFVTVGAGMVGRRGTAGLGGSGVSACWGVAIAITTWVQGETTPWLNSTQSHRTQLRRWPILPSGDPRAAKLIDA